MPSVMLVTNGRSTSGTGITSKDLLRKNSNGSAGRPYPRDQIMKHRQHRKINEIDDVKRSSSANGHIDMGNVEAIRFRLRKGRTGKNRNAAIFDPSTFHTNNNGPVKAFPLNNNESPILPASHVGNKIESEYVSRSSSNVSNSASSSASTTNEKRNPNTRPPLHRINGHTNMRPHQPLQTTSRVNDPSNLPIARPNSGPIRDKGHRRTKPTRTGSHALPVSWSEATSKHPAIHVSGTGDISGDSELNFVKFAERQLPPGARELQKDLFVPGSKCYFQRKANLPLLKFTDASILKRRSSVSHSKKNNVTVNGQRKVQNGMKETSEYFIGGNLASGAQVQSIDYYDPTL